MRRCLLLMLVFALGAAAQDVTLLSPLTTVVRAAGTVSGDRVLEADVVVPRDAPVDLGVGAFAADHAGRWFQQARPGRLPPGRHHLAFVIAGDRPLTALPLPDSWRAADAATCDQSGLFLWAAAGGGSPVVIERLSLRPLAPTAAAGRRLLGLTLAGADGGGGACRVATGERWTAGVLPSPFPVNPDDPREFALDAVVTGPDGEQRIPACWVQPMRGADRGDREVVVPDGAGRFELRFRPARAGSYRIVLEARWGGGEPLRTPLPPLQALGADRDLIARVDPDDHRFLSAGGVQVWPVGLNLHSTFDVRCAQALGTRLTPARGTLVYDALLARAAAAGVDAVEIWLSSWNLALEWRGDWPGFAGVGRYNQANAWRLDQVLDRAWALGVRVNLVLNNHGQVSPKSDREWKDNPYNRERGGILGEAERWFDDPAALAAQERTRRYLVARFADHPAVLGWKLFSEVNLTAGRGQALVDWHAQAAASLHRLDSYRHPVATHWSGDYRQPGSALCALPGLDYLCIDAYRGGSGGEWNPVADLLYASTADPARGLSRFAKPVLVTEYGGSWRDSPLAVREADHRSGAWSALVAGHAGGPMFWWWEWIDQGDRWAPYRAIRAFLVGEDLRGHDAGPVALSASAGGASLWARAWARPGRVLAYVIDPRWGAGGQAVEVSGLRLTVGQSIHAGPLRWEWWDADAGRVVTSDTRLHGGGRLVLEAPPFRAHLALKLWRER